MKILNVSIRNFAAIGEADVGLDDKGLVLIQGDNQDDTSQVSNGAGKSTLPDAVCWAFYGETAKGESGDKIVNRKAKKDTSVEVTVVDEETDEVFRISRYRKHKTHKNMLRLEIENAHGWRDLTKGTDKLTQEMVNKVLGCGLEVFSSAIYAGQEAMPDLPGMTDKQLKVLVEESAGISQLQEADTIARRIMNERKAVVQDFAAKITAKQSVVESLKSQHKQAQDNEANFEDTRKAEIQFAEDAVVAAESTFDATLGGKIEAKLTELAGQEADVRAKIAGSDEERRIEKELATVVNAAALKASTAASTVAQARKSVDYAKHQLDHVGDKVGTSCHSCGHTIEASDLAGSEEAAKKAVEVAENQLVAAQDAANDAGKAHSEALKALERHTSSMTDISAMSASLSDIADKATKLRAALQGWKASSQAIDNLKAAVEKHKTKTNPYTQQVLDIDKRIDATELEAAALEASRVAAAEELAVAEAALRVFSPAGVRAHILDTVTPLLNARTSYYLSTLTDGNVAAIWSTISATAKGELREKFVIDVQSATGGESFKSLSGGEKRKVRLACAMALQDLVASRATKPIKLFIADEIDHALDPAGLERLMTILDSKSRDKGTVLVISHSDLRDSIRNVVTVTKKGGKATLDATCLM